MLWFIVINTRFLGISTKIPAQKVKLMNAFEIVVLVANPLQQAPIYL
jgi:hypothetical protein